MFSSTCSNNNSASDLTMETILNAMARVAMLQPAPPTIRIVKNDLLVETIQTKYPRKKKNRRWSKKYAKKYTITVPSKSGYFLKDQGVFVCHSAMADEVLKQFQEGKPVTIF